MAHAQKNDALALARQAAQLTQVGLAARSSVSQSVISSMEGGHVPGALESAILIARALGTTVEALFGALVTSPAATSPSPSPTPKRRKASRAEKPTKAPGTARTRTKPTPQKALDRRVKDLAA